MHGKYETENKSLYKKKKEEKSSSCGLVGIAASPLLPCEVEGFPTDPFSRDQTAVSSARPSQQPYLMPTTPALMQCLCLQPSIPCVLLSGFLF